MYCSSSKYSNIVFTTCGIISGVEERPVFCSVKLEAIDIFYDDDNIRHVSQ